jgi:hypothetical protein
LEEAGIEITSRWLQEKEPLNSQMGQHTDAFYLETATDDIEDIDRADAVLFFSEDPLVGLPRGGRHVEFGYALGTRKSIAVIGPKENVFHYLKGEFNILHFKSVEHFRDSYLKHGKPIEEARLANSLL